MQAYPTAELWAESLGELLVTEGTPQVGDLLFLALNEEDAEELPDAEQEDAELPEPENSRPAIRFDLDCSVLAPQGYRLLRVSNDLPENESYWFDGQPLWLSAQRSYLLDENDPGVFVAFIPDSYPLAEIGTLLAAEPIEPQTLEYSADVNEDGLVNIADANAVYQMIQNGADYYTDEQISPEARLRLCYSDLRDLNAILNIINGQTENDE